MDSGRVNGIRSQLVAMKFLFIISLFMYLTLGCEDNRYVDSYGDQNSTDESEQTEDDY